MLGLYHGDAAMITISQRYILGQLGDLVFESDHKAVYMD